MQRSHRNRPRLFELACLLATIGGFQIVAGAQQVGDCDGCIPWAGMIRGRVVNARGQGIPGIIVHARKHNQEKGMIRNGETNQKGFFRFFVPHGRYTVYAGNESLGYPEDYGGIYLDTVMHSDISVGKDKVTKVVLRLGRPLAHLSGRIVDSSTGGHVKDVDLTISLLGAPSVYLETAPDLSGRFSLICPPAPFILRVRAPGYETKQLVFNTNSSKKLLVALRPETTQQRHQ